MRSWRRVFTSEEAFVESKAGACPPRGGIDPDWREVIPCPTCNGSGLVGELQDCGDCAGTGLTSDWPLPSPPPYTPPDDEGLAEPRE